MNQVPKNPAPKFQIVGAGLCRTGTSSFKKALEILGLGPCYHMQEVFIKGDSSKWEEYAADTSKADLLHSILEGNGYQSSCDIPSSPYWREQLKLYPDAKVILTKRDVDKWYQSCEDTVFRMQPNHPVTPFGIKLCYFFGILSESFGGMLDATLLHRVFHGDWSKENVLRCYEEFNREVVEACPKDKLLIFEVTEGWKPLCAFLNVPVPKVPFPHVNDTKSFQARVAARERSGYLTLGCVTVGAAVVVLLGCRYLTGSTWSGVLQDARTNK